VGAAAVGVTGEILCTTFFARTGMRTRAFMRYSAHVSGDAPRSERSSRGCAASADPGATPAVSFHRRQALHRLSATQEQLQSREREIEHLKLLLAKLHRMQFGRKSEKLERQIEQLELRLEELESKRSEQEPTRQPAPVTASSTPTAAKPTRRALPDHLPRQTRRHEPKETACPQCQGELRKLGEDVSECWSTCPPASW
jgi:TolA-binding protein